MKILIKSIKKLLFGIRFKHAVKKANKLSHLFGMKYYVIYINGSMRVIPKRTERQLIATRRFKKDTTIHDIERHALYITR